MSCTGPIATSIPPSLRLVQVHRADGGVSPPVPGETPGRWLPAQCEPGARHEYRRLGDRGRRMGQPELLERTDRGRRRAAGIYGAVVTAAVIAALGVPRLVGGPGREPAGPVTPGRHLHRGRARAGDDRAEGRCPHPPALTRHPGPAQPIAAAMMSRACSWMAARCPGPRKDSAYSL